MHYTYTTLEKLSQGHSPQARIVGLLAAIAEHLKRLHLLDPQRLYSRLTSSRVEVDESLQHARLVDPGVDVGVAEVPPYLRAPEVLAGRGSSEASNVYGFGMLAYEVLAGLSPADIQGIVDAGNRPPFPRAPLLHDSLADLIDKCWRADPDLRPSMRDVHAKLEEFLTLQGRVAAFHMPIGQGTVHLIRADVFAQVAYWAQMAAAGQM